MPIGYFIGIKIRDFSKFAHPLYGTNSSVDQKVLYHTFAPMFSIDPAKIADELLYHPEYPLLFSSGLFLFICLGFIGLYWVLRRHEMQPSFQNLKVHLIEEKDKLYNFDFVISHN